MEGFDLEGNNEDVRIWPTSLRNPASKRRAALAAKPVRPIASILKGTRATLMGGPPFDEVTQLYIDYHSRSD